MTDFEQLKALSVQQPYAEQIITGEKTIEYRSKPTTIRGRVYIYASLKLSVDDDEFEESPDCELTNLPRGVIIGTVEITNCEGSDGNYEWHLDNPHRLAEPLTTREQPQAGWFYPFGRPEDQFTGEEQPDAGESSPSPVPIRFAPLIAASDRPPFTPYHSRYLACELTRQVGADQADKLAQSLSNATVDLNPHQVDAALFAFRSPLSKGAILADEVGLGKTIEAGILISQLWAEKKRRILVITPASLRKQWSRELAEKFFLPSGILESASYRKLSRQTRSPFEQNQVVICSYQFASIKAPDLQNTPWDLVVIDEAHRLRNVYKTGNKIARNIRNALQGRPKVLLTATPLQNSLMELYGLVTFVDDHVFGSAESFRDQYTRKSDSLTDGPLANLRTRLAPICQRTLRKQVLEYVRYTNRIPITEDFTPSSAEQELYDKLSEYLQRDNLHALPGGQRQLIELVLRKILASSSFAVAGTLETFISRLESKLAKSAYPSGEQLISSLEEEYEAVDGLQEEWNEDQDNANAASDTDPTDASDSAEPTSNAPTDDDSADLRQSLERELAELVQFKTLAESIHQNAKGDSLLKALRIAFRKAEELGASPKALIFTESRRTQVYLRTLLESHGYAGKLVLFNGTNTDPESKRIYREWQARHAGQDCISGSPSADMRAALVEEFAERAAIMIATESAAEGVNLQFCSLVVNYDLPWNPQRIEQRIGRCHRYGQKHDVVVVNFVNRGNEADQRVFELLNAKLKLFDGVFGASDEILGSLGSGVDFEKRINDIHRHCRTSEQITQAFDQLQRDLDKQITATLESARNKLLENFDEEVNRKLKLRKTETRQGLDRYSDWLWALTATELADCATFDCDGHCFILHEHPLGITPDDVPLGRYRLLPPHDEPEGDAVVDHRYRPGHPLAEGLIARALQYELPPRELVLDYACRGTRSMQLEQLLGQSGWLRVEKLTISSLETEETLLLVGITDGGVILDHETCEKLLTVPATAGQELPVEPAVHERLEAGLQARAGRVIADSQRRNETYYDAESDKLDFWADDLKDGLEREMRDIRAEVKNLKRESRMGISLTEKLKLQDRIRELELRERDKRRRIFDAHDEVDARRKQLIDQTRENLRETTSREHLFSIRWRID